METAGAPEPISVYLVLRHTAPIADAGELTAIYDRLVLAGQDLLEDRVIPRVIVRLREELPLT